MDTGRRLLGLIFVAACGGSSPPPASTRIGPALIAALEAAPRAPWRCAAPDGPALATETLGAWKLGEHTITREGGGTISIGVIADAGGPAPQTMAALGRLRAKLADVDLVLALGGMGSSQQDLEAVLGALTDRALLVVLPGDLEPVSGLELAIAALRAKGQLVVDGRLAQRIEMPGVTIATIAGASDASRLVAGSDGCTYRADDLAPAFADLTAAKGIRILAAVEAPRVRIAGEAAGELALVPGATQELDITLHGPVDAAATPARTGGRDGEAIPLSPGTSDATLRLPGPRRTTTAGILTITGTAWKWRPIADREF